MLKGKSTFGIILRDITYHKGPVPVFSSVPVVAVVKSFSTEREVESHASILRAQKLCCNNGRKSQYVIADNCASYYSGVFISQKVSW